MKVNKGQSQPEIVADAFLILEAWFRVDHFNTKGFDCDSGGKMVIPVIPCSFARPLKPGSQICFVPIGFEYDEPGVTSWAGVGPTP